MTTRLTLTGPSRSTTRAIPTVRLRITIRAIRINPKYTDAFVNRAEIKAEKEDWDGAIADYKMAVEIGSEKTRRRTTNAG